MDGVGYLRSMDKMALPEKSPLLSSHIKGSESGTSRKVGQSFRGRERL